MHLEDLISSQTKVDTGFILYGSIESLHHLILMLGLK